MYRARRVLGLLFNVSLYSDASSDLSPCSVTGSASAQLLLPHGTYELSSSADRETAHLRRPGAFPKSALGLVRLLPREVKPPFCSPLRDPLSSTAPVARLRGCSTAQTPVSQNARIGFSSRLPGKRAQGARLAQSGKHLTPDLRVVNSSPTLGVELN